MHSVPFTGKLQKCGNEGPTFQGRQLVYFSVLGEVEAGRAPVFTAVPIQVRSSPALQPIDNGRVCRGYLLQLRASKRLKEQRRGECGNEGSKKFHFKTQLLEFDVQHQFAHTHTHILTIAISTWYLVHSNTHLKLVYKLGKWAMHHETNFNPSKMYPALNQKAMNWHPF